MDDWPSKRFPTRNSSFAGHHAPSPNYSTMRSNFEDGGVPVHVVRESPEKAWQHKQKERHNSTGSSAATSSSTGSNDSTGQSSHKPRVFHIPIQVEPRDEGSARPPKRASPPRVSPEKMRDSVINEDPSHQQLSRSASYASEPPKNTPKIEMPQGIRAQSVPTETFQRRISPERKRLSPERPRGISRTQSMSYRPIDQTRIFHHPVKVENVAMSPRRTSSDPIVEELTYRIPRPMPYPSGMEGFNTILRKSPPETVAEEQSIPSSAPSKPQRFTTSAQVNVKAPPVPKTENLNHVTRIPINFESPNKKEYHTNVTIEPTSEKPVRVSPERNQQTNRSESPASDFRPIPRNPSSSVNHPQPVPSGKEQVENLKNETNGCDNVDNSPKPPAPSPPKPQTALEKIADIQENVAKANKVVGQFDGAIFDKGYLYIEESLTQNLLKLDVIKTDGKDEVRKARKAVVVNIQASLSNLEARAKRNASAPNNTPNEQEEGYCSMETEQVPPVEDTSIDVDKSEPMETKGEKCDVPHTTDSEPEQTKL